MKQLMLAALALALLPQLGKTADDTSGNGFDLALRRNNEKADLVEYLKSL